MGSSSREGASPAWSFEESGESRDEAGASVAGLTSEARALRSARKWWVRHALAGGALLAFGALLAGIAHTRGVDGDEPFYAAAIDSVARGKRLYLDFFHPQGPVQPLLYSLVPRLGSQGLVSLRLVSVLCCVGTGLVWWRFLTRLMPSLVAAPLCLLVMALSDGGFFAWGASLKTYSLTTLLTAAGAYAWWEGFRQPDARRARPWLALSGAAWALSAGARLSFVAPGAFLWLVLAFRAARPSALRTRRGWEELLAWSAGAGAGALLVATQCLRDPKAFWFDGYTAQKLRGVAPVGRARLEYVFYTVHDSVVQFPWLAAMVVAGTASALALAFGLRSGDQQRGDRSLSVMPLAGAAYVAAMFTVHPQYAQYYEGSLGAFFVPCVLVYVARHAAAIPAGMLVLALGLLVSSSARPLPAVAGDVATLDTLRSVSKLIAKNTTPKDEVWGYHAIWPFQARREYVTGMQCQFGYGVAQSMTAKDRGRYRLLSIAEIADYLTRRRPKMAVTDAGSWVLSYAPEDGKRIDENLAKGYRVILDQSPIKVWLRNDVTPAP